MSEIPIHPGARRALPALSPVPGHASLSRRLCGLAGAAGEPTRPAGGRTADPHPGGAPEEQGHLRQPAHPPGVAPRRHRLWPQPGGADHAEASDHGPAPRRFAVTTDSDHPLPVAPNRLGQDFRVDRPDAAWSGDITYLWTGEGWLYLSVVLDLFSRRVVGWSM
jgi:transposase InsO family protein